MKSNDMSEQEQALAAEIAALYRLTAQEQASQELDREILALARRQLQQGEEQGETAPGRPPLPSPWRAYRWPLSTAASVLLVAGLLLLDPYVRHRQAVPELTPMMRQVPASDAAATSGAPAAKLQQAPEMKGQRQSMAADITPKPTPEVALPEPSLANLTLALQRLQQYLDEGDYAGARTFAERLKARFPEVQSAESGGHELWLRLSAEMLQADGRAR